MFLSQRPNHLEGAACAELPAHEAERLFLTGDVGDFRQAKRICDDCPVLEQCRAEGDELEPAKKGYVAGVLGGEFPSERIARRKREAAA